RTEVLEATELAFRGAPERELLAKCFDCTDRPWLHLHRFRHRIPLAEQARVHALLDTSSHVVGLCHECLRSALPLPIVLYDGERVGVRGGNKGNGKRLPLTLSLSPLSRRAVRGMSHSSAGACPAGPARTGYFLVVETQKGPSMRYCDSIFGQLLKPIQRQW